MAAADERERGLESESMAKRASKSSPIGASSQEKSSSIGARAWPDGRELSHEGEHRALFVLYPTTRELYYVNSKREGVQNKKERE